MLASLELDLPDDNYLPERVDYGYDSAGQQRSMLYSDGSSTQALYKANLVDPFGRVRDATYGASTYYATYADTGRRLFKNSVVKALNGIRSVGVGSYDAVGRELSRTEQTRIGKPTTTMTYDALGRLATSVQVNGTTTIGNRSFGYDALGNINDLHDYVGSLGATIQLHADDHRRLLHLPHQLWQRLRPRLQRQLRQLRKRRRRGDAHGNAQPRLLQLRRRSPHHGHVGRRRRFPLRRGRSAAIV